MPKSRPVTPQQYTIFTGHTNIDLAGLGEPCDSLFLISSKVLGPDSEEQGSRLTSIFNYEPPALLCSS